MSTTYTTNYHLGKQEDTGDNFNMSVITENMDIIDTALSGKQATLTTAQLAAVNSGIDSTKVAQIETNKNNISFLTEVMPNAEEVSKGNMFDKSTSINGKYVNPNNGTLPTNSSYTASEYIAVVPNSTIELKFYDTLYGAYYGENKNFISGILYQNTRNYRTITQIVPENAHYIRVSTATNVIDALSVAVKEFLKNYMIHQSQVDGLEEIKITKYTVGTLSGYDFSRLRDAFAACADGTSANRYIIEFYGRGIEYDLLTEITQEELSDPSFIGITIPKYTCLKGMGGKNKNIISLRLASNSTQISTLNLYGSSSLDGLTIIGNKTRYTVHDDYSDAGAERTIKNCKVIAESSTYQGVWGAGSRSGNKWTFENCEFISKQSATLPFFCHNNISFAEPTILKFENCRFKNTASAENAYVNFRTLNNNANGIINEVYMYGCDALKVNLIEENASSYGSGILFDCSGYGNTFTSSDCTYTSTDGIDYSDRFDFI